jgi:uncharacterized protein YigA (DUF484 family)
MVPENAEGAGEGAGMADTARAIGLADEVRDLIITRPEVILEDGEVMRALIAANERAMGGNIVDLRGLAMKRMEERLDRLEATHRSVIAAAYENLAATNVVHRAILALLEPTDFQAFLSALEGPVAAALRVDSVRLVLESREGGDPALARLGGVLCVVEPGFAETYAGRGAQGRPVILRQAIPETARVHGEASADIRSEAILRLDLGPGRLPALLVLGAEDPHKFRPAQGTDLLAVFGGVFERQMRRWLG